MHKPAAIVAILLVATLLSPAPSIAQDAEANEAAELFSSENMSHVDNISYRPLDAREGSDLPYGTDIEFATLEGAEGALTRLGGPTRLETAVEISRDTFIAAEDVVIATGFTYADALAGAPLAAVLRAPILLATVNGLPEVTAEEIQRLGARRAVLLGGEAALSAGVADALTELGLEVERIAGENRFGTAAAIAARIGPLGEVLVAKGEDADPEQGWQTALSAAALGAAHDIPLLLVGEDRLPEETRAVIADEGDGTDPTHSPAPNAVTLIGGEQDVSAEVAAEIEAAAASLERIGGPDHYETSRLAAEESFARGALRTQVFAATGRAFADGLVSAAAVGTTGGVLYLVDGLDIGATPQLQESLADVGVGTLRLAGGTAAIDGDAADALGEVLAESSGQREYALAGTEYNGLQIVDITDPEQSEVVAVYDCITLQGDPQVFSQDGRTFVTYTSEDTSALDHQSGCVRQAVAAGDIEFTDETGGGPEGDQPDGVPDDKTPGYGTFVAEITNPLIPTYGGFIAVPEGSHNGTVHPSGQYFYNSNSSLIVNPVLEPEQTTYIEYYDISDLANIERLGTLPLQVRPGLGTESHDITFNAEGTRAYSAALSQTVIINTEDPANPSVISNFVDPAINVEHQADPVDVVDSEGNARTLLIVEDELAGAAGNGMCPGGGMHVYDITGENELNPQLHKVGTYFIPEFRPAGTGSGQGESVTCTAHVFRIYPEQGIITIAWYNAGVWVLDISGLADQATNPTSQPIQTLGFAYFSNSDTWSFKTNTFEEDGSFYAFGNDILRGLDVYRFDASAQPAAEDDPALAGRWANQATAVTMAQRALAANGYAPDEQAAPRCLLPDDGRS